MPLRLFVWPPDEEADTPTDYVGVMIETWNGDSLHIGVIYRTAQGGAWILHHKGHFDLQHNPPEKGQIIAVCPIDPIEIPIIARFFRNLYRRNRRGFPYGFSAAGLGWFSSDGDYIQPPNSLGLCCQTFVLAAYLAAEIPLIDPTDPPQRDDDAARQTGLIDKWQGQIAASLPETQTHFAMVRAAVGTGLCRPLEVGGAALAPALPCGFAEARELGREIVALLENDHD